jgi:hypothetical protein
MQLPASPLTIEQTMPTAIEVSTAAYLYGAEPSMTAIASRAAQRREGLLGGQTEAIPAEIIWLEQRGPQAIPTEDQTVLLWQAQQYAAMSESHAREARAVTACVVQPGVTFVASGAPVEPKTQADRTVAQLLEFERLEADWDGHQAAKPLAFSLKDARIFIRALAPESIIPRPALHADGHAILFLRGPDKYAELEFLGGARIGFYARRGEREWSDEVFFDGCTLPEGLLQIGLAI